mmetsp:Transcript_45565/g.143340  ORF Transcript_45565/g.143340 Transcript_45565/m.143340 type:complete len:212 (-) Transcript_45565:157-792(-)
MSLLALEPGHSAGRRSATASRRSATANFAAALLSAAPALRAAAKVDGLPLYAPKPGAIGGSAYPEEGFEALLPRVEGFAAGAAAALAAAKASDWDSLSAATSPAALAYQSAQLGKFASILGDDAYTALTLKREYLQGVSALSAAVASAASGGGEEAARAVKAAEVMSSSLDSMLALVPPKVVAQVRKREQALAALAARAAAPAEADPAPGD